MLVCQCTLSRNQYRGLFSLSSLTVSLEICFTKGLMKSSTSKNLLSGFGELLSLFIELRLQFSSLRMKGLSDSCLGFWEGSNCASVAKRDVLIFYSSLFLVTKRLSSKETSVKQEFYFYSLGSFSSKCFTSVHIVDCVGMLSISCCDLSSRTGVIRL